MFEQNKFQRRDAIEARLINDSTGHDVPRSAGWLSGSMARSSAAALVLLGAAAMPAAAGLGASDFAVDVDMPKFLERSDLV